MADISTSSSGSDHHEANSGNP